MVVIFSRWCFGMALDNLVRYPMQQCSWHVFLFRLHIFGVVRYLGHHGSESRSLFCMEQVQLHVFKSSDV
jgi:hypothetical protein